MAEYKAKTNWLPDDPINEDDLNRWEAGIKAANEEGDEHRNNKQNPHGVTKAQLGLSQVENIRQASKADFDSHERNKQNPHEVNKSQVGLGSVQNYPVASQAQAEAGTHTASYMTPQRTKQAIDIHNTLLNHISVLGLNALNFDVEPVDYPVGISYFYINSADMKYPGQNVFITTFRDIDPSGQPRAFQTIQGIGSNYNQTWTRGSRNGVWGDLIESESKAGAQSKVNAHENKKTNPHGVTKEQVGLGNVTNDQQARKVDYDAHVGNKQNPHNVTTEQINIISPVAADRPGSDYPNGNTMFQTANGELIGYPSNQIIVQTIRQGSHRCFQSIHDASNSVDKVWFRTWRLDGGWRELSEAETVTGAQLKAEQAERNAKAASVSKSGDTVNGTLTVAQGLVLGTTYSSIDGLLYFRDSNDDIRAKMARGWVSLETEDGAAAKVKAHADQKTNPHGVTKAQVGLGSVLNYPIATQAQAEAGNHTTSYMTPQRTKEAIQVLATSDVVNTIARKSANDLPRTYPMGVTTFSNANDNSWPTTYGTVVTIRNADNSTLQYHIRWNNVGSTMRVRSSRDIENAWQDWVEIETVAGAEAKISKAIEDYAIVAKDGTPKINLTSGDFLDHMSKLSNGVYTFYASNEVKNIPNPNQSYRGVFHKVSANFGWLVGQDWDGNNYSNFLNTGNWKGWKDSETTSGAQAKVNAHANNKNNPHNVSTEQINTIDFKKASEAVGTYPTGVTIFAISSHNNDVEGYPFGYGTVFTVRVHNSRTYQILYGNGDTVNGRRYWTRWGFEGTWTEWYEEGQTPLRWSRASLLNRWEQNGTRPVEYAKDSAGTIHIEGAMRNGVYGNPDLSAFVLPEGFRPKKTRVINVASASGAISYTRVVIRDNGTVWVEDVSRSGAESYVDMSCSFPADR